MGTKIVAGLGIVLAGVAVVGCAERLPADQRLAAAQQATTEADTARMAVEFVSEMGGDGGARMDMTIVGDGEVDFAAEQAALALEVPGGSERAASVVDGDVVYTQTHMSSPEGDEVRWRRHDDPGGGPAMLFGAGMTRGAPDPTTLLATLGTVEGSIDELGADEVRGEPVEGFAFTADAEALAGDADVPDEFADVSATMEAWLDSANRVRRLTATFALADLVAADSPDGDVPDRLTDGRVAVTLELFDFGADVAIEVPADEDIFDPTQPTSAPGAKGSAPAPDAEALEAEAIERDAVELEVEAESAEPATPPSGSEAGSTEGAGQMPGGSPAEDQD